MHVGTTIPITESRGDLIGLRDFVQAAEELGYSHIRILDHGGRLPHAGTSLRRTDCRATGAVDPGSGQLQAMRKRYRRPLENTTPRWHTGRDNGYQRPHWH